MRHKFFLILAATFVATVTHAHSVWIESKGHQLVIRFAEPGSGFETSPGYLDNLNPPVAFAVITNKAVPVDSSKKSDHFLLTGASITNALCVETAFTVRAGRKPYFYARWQPVGTVGCEPLLNLDLVPAGKPGEVRAYFRGEPLGNVEATLRVPDGTEQELTANADGFIHFTADKPGHYLLTIAHYREVLAGFHLGVPYKETSHNASLSWEQPKE